jgi:hypothetical protein
MQVLQALPQPTPNAITRTMHHNSKRRVNTHQTSGKPKQVYDLFLTT